MKQFKISISENKHEGECLCCHIKGNELYINERLISEEFSLDEIAIRTLLDALEIDYSFEVIQ